MFKVLRLLILMCLLVYPATLEAGLSWQKVTTNLTDTDLRTLTISPHTPSSIYVGSATTLYQSLNQGQDFKAVLTPTGESRAIREIYVSPTDPNRVYAATEAGLFESKTSGKSWNRIYFSSNKDENLTLCVLESQGLLFLGTKKGLRFKGLEDSDWRRMAQELDDEPIYFSAQDQEFIYFATDKKLYRFKKTDKKLKNIFTVGFARLEQAASETEEMDNPEQIIDIRFLEIDSSQNLIFLAAKAGIYSSKTQGEHWERLESTSVPVEELTSLKILSHGCPEGSLSCLSLLATTTKGAFLYQDQRWEPVYQGMETNDIRLVALDNQGNIYAATNRGLFLLTIDRGTGHVTRDTDLEKALPSDGQSHLGDYKSLSEYFADEPTVREVHDLAVDYAQVHPDKIKEWRQAASKRAWLPSLSMGLDVDRSLTTTDNVSTSTTSGKVSYFTGPDDKSFDDDLGWDVSASWDLADLIWNPDQTSIETRSKEMVKLREDILDQITRLYFERRRVQMELARINTQTPEMFDKQMRVEELTALIDAYTGGAFSRLIEERKVRKTLEREPSPVARDPSKDKK